MWPVSAAGECFGIYTSVCLLLLFFNYVLLLFIVSPGFFFAFGKPQEYQTRNNNISNILPSLRIYPHTSVEGHMCMHVYCCQPGWWFSFSFQIDQYHNCVWQAHLTGKLKDVCFAANILVGKLSGHSSSSRTLLSSTFLCPWEMARITGSEKSIDHLSEVFRVLLALESG